MAVPDATPVTNPVLEIEATPVLLDVHGFDTAGVTEPVSWVVALMHTDVVPEMVGFAGWEIVKDWLKLQDVIPFKRTYIV